MRLTQMLTIAACILITFGSAHCKRDKDESTLPPETTTGVGTFGCKVNGRVFVPKSGMGRPGLYVKYSNNGDGLGGGWFFGLVANDHTGRDSETIQIGSDSVFFGEGVKYKLEEGKGYAFGRYSYGLNRFEMRDIDLGELEITRHDTEKRVLSARFWFNARSLIDTSTNRISDGRFDVRY